LNRGGAEGAEEFQNFRFNFFLRVLCASALNRLRRERAGAREALNNARFRASSAPGARAKRVARRSASTISASRKKRRGRKKTLTFIFATRKFAHTKGGDSAMAKKKSSSKKSSAKKSTTKKSSKK